MPPVITLLEDLLLVGDFDAMASLTSVLTAATGSESSQARRQHANAAVERLVGGSMMRHLAVHLATIDDAQFERVKTMCTSMGEVVVRPIAETLAIDIAERARDRLTAILVAFGSVARRQVERLKGSDNPAVRRTALNLLRELGGQEALPELTELLNDRSPQIQREAVRAILNIGSDRAFEIIQQALTTGSEASRGAIMKSVAAARDERAAPMLAYILGHTDYRGAQASIYLSAIEALGALRDPQAVQALKDALFRGDWWAPRRTAALRGAAASALSRIGTAEALDVLEQGLASGPRGVRSAVRPHLAKARARRGVEAKT
jgi:HEAT repeat protein